MVFLANVASSAVVAQAKEGRKDGVISEVREAKQPTKEVEKARKRESERVPQRVSE